MWIETHRHIFEQVGVEVEAEVTIAEGMKLRGRIDRLEKTMDGDYHIVDFKSGTNHPSEKTIADHVQLLTYQLILHHGAFDGTKIRPVRSTESGMTVDGATLVYPEKDTKKIWSITQAAKTEEQLAEFENQLPDLLQELRGPELQAQRNPRCATCKLKPICPVFDTGKWTTEPTTNVS